MQRRWGELPGRTRGELAGSARLRPTAARRRPARSSSARRQFLEAEGVTHTLGVERGPRSARSPADRPRGGRHHARDAVAPYGYAGLYPPGLDAVSPYGYPGARCGRADPPRRR